MYILITTRPLSRFLAVIALYIVLSLVQVAVAEAAGSIASDHALVEGLVSYWPLDEESGIREDVHGINHLTSTQATSVDSGNLNGAVDLERTENAYLMIDESAQTGLDVTGDLSIASWVRTESVPPANPGENGSYTIASKSSEAGNQMSWIFRYGINLEHADPGVSQLNFVWGDANTGAFAVQTSVPAVLGIGEWHHVSVVLNTTEQTIQFYVDGVPAGDAQAGPDALFNSSAPFIVGAYDNGHPLSSFDGSMDEVGIWNRALTAEDVAKLYNSGEGLPYEESMTPVSPVSIDTDPELENGLISYWPMNEESGIRKDVVGQNDVSDSSTVTGVSGKFEGASHFIRSELDYLVIDDVSQVELEPSNISFSFWMRNPVGSADYKDLGIISKRTGTSGYQVSLENWGQMWWQVGNDFMCTMPGCGGTIYTQYENIDDGVWHHIVTTYDGSVGTIFVDGARAAEKAWRIHNLDTSMQFYFGQILGKHFLDGDLDEVGIWNRALTAEEVAKLYNHGMGLPYSLDEEPDPEPEPTGEISSVAFLPGIMGSRLYVREGDTEYRLWETVGEQQIDLLALDTNAKSNHPGIYTRDAIDYALKITGNWSFGGENYANFIAFMNELKDDKVVLDWSTLVYDWRLGLEALRNNGVRYGATGENINYNEASQEPYLYAELERLADAAPSGKVTIVAHSNGGIIAKYLLKKLEENNDPLLLKIDRLILIGSPQLGTPKAVGELLHGTIVKKPATRASLENMPGAYQLLPSQAYFARLAQGEYVPQHPVVFWEDSIARVPGWEGYVGKEIKTYDELSAFLSEDAGRIKPGRSDIDTPNVLPGARLAEADETHAYLDAWTVPVHIELIEVAGVGLDTPHGIRYYDHCARNVCSSALAHKVGRWYEHSWYGDGTVMSGSATAGNTAARFVNLWLYNELEEENRHHADMLSAKPVQDIVRQALSGNEEPIEYVSEEVELPSGTVRYRLRAFSPVDLHLTDGAGRHTGVLEREEAEGSLGRRFEEEVPNSYYMEWGEVKYLGIGAEDEPFEIVLDGTDVGTFRLEVDVAEGDEVTSTLVFDALPVTGNAKGKLVLGTDGSVGTLILDVDGDGKHDVTVSPAVGGTELSASDLFRRLHVFVAHAAMPNWLRTWIDFRLGLAEKQIEKGKKGNITAAKAILQTILWTVEFRTGTFIDEADSEVLRGLLMALLERL